MALAGPKDDGQRRSTAGTDAEPRTSAQYPLLFQLLMRSDAGTNYSWNNNHNHNNNNIWGYSWRRRSKVYVAFLSFFSQQLFRQFALFSPLFKPTYWLSARWPSSPLPRPDFSQLACRV
jgi:hypothetical protein